MLNLARLESGAMPVHKFRGDLLALLHYFVDSFQSMANRKNVRLHFLPGMQVLDMDFDPEKLEDILANLLSNAIKFTPPGGDVYLTVDIVAKNEEGQQLRVQVRDTGIGIPEDKLQFIFERFFQVDDPNAPVEAGSGIGLTLVKEYVKLLGGTVEVQSRPGKGSEFSLYLPITRQAAPFTGIQGSVHQPEQLARTETPDLDFPGNELKTARHLNCLICYW